MIKYWDKIKEWVVNHKIWSFVIGVIIVIGCFAIADAQNDTDGEKSKYEQQYQKEDNEPKKHVKTSQKGKQLNKEKKAYKNTKEDIKKVITSGKFDKMEYNKSDKELVVTLKNIDGFSDKGKRKNINQEIVNVVRGAKDTKLDVDTISVNVNGQYQDDELNKETLREATTQWDIETAKKLDHTNIIQVQENPERYATLYQRF